MPRKLSRTMDEARSAAAEYALSQLGYCSEVPATASAFPPVATQPLALTDSSAGFTAPSLPAAAFSPHLAAPKPASWGPPTDPTTAATAAIYAPPHYPAPDPYLPQQMYVPPVTGTPGPAHQELYPQPLHLPTPPPHSRGF
jgi:hypothetical protein